MEKETDTKTGKDTRLYVRLSPQEQDDLRKKAKEAGVSMSEYVRRLVHDGKVKSELNRDDLRALINLGNNLNQAVRWSHQNQKLSADIEQIIVQLQEVLNKL